MFPRGFCTSLSLISRKSTIRALKNLTYAPREISRKNTAYHGISFLHSSEGGLANQTLFLHPLSAIGDPPSVHTEVAKNRHTKTCWGMDWSLRTFYEPDHQPSVIFRFNGSGSEVSLFVRQFGFTSADHRGHFRSAVGSVTDFHSRSCNGSFCLFLRRCLVFARHLSHGTVNLFKATNGRTGWNRDAREKRAAERN